jgi:ribonuclease T2
MFYILVLVSVCLAYASAELASMNRLAEALHNSTIINKLGWSHNHHNHHEKKSGSGDGNFLYVLAYSWTPGFCATEQNDPGCSAPQDFWTSHFTLHGLWPQNYGSGYPSFCTKEAFDPKVPEAVGMSTMNTYWPNVQATTGSSSYDDFWEHEWTKHGTCSTLSQQDFFETAIDTIKKFGTPSVVTQNVGKTVKAEDIRDGFGGKSKVALLCSGKSLTGVYTCWAQSNGKPTEQVDCSDNDVAHEDTCSDDEIEIKNL